MKASQWISHKHAFAPGFAHVQTLCKIYAGERLNLSQFTILEDLSDLSLTPTPQSGVCVCVCVCWGCSELWMVKGLLWGSRTCDDVMCHVHFSLKVKLRYFFFIKSKLLHLFCLDSVNNYVNAVRPYFKELDLCVFYHITVSDIVIPLFKVHLSLKPRRSIKLGVNLSVSVSIPQ